MYNVQQLLVLLSSRHYVDYHNKQG